jgi:hypothetical protein
MNSEWAPTKISQLTGGIVRGIMPYINQVENNAGEESRSSPAKVPEVEPAGSFSVVGIPGKELQ